MSDVTSPPWTRRAAIAAVGLVAWLAFLSGAAQGIGTAEGDRFYSPADSPWQQSMPPTLDSPFARPWSPSSIAGRGSMAIALGRRTALRDLSAASTAIAIVLFGLWLSGAGVPLFPVLLGMVGLAAGPAFWWRGVSWTPDALSPALALLAAWSAWRWLITERAIFAAVAVLAALLAVAEEASWLACLPAIAIFLWGRVPSRAGRLRALTAVGVIAVCGVVFWLAAPSAGASSRAGLTAMITREFTPLGALLATIGVAALGASRDRRALVALVAGLIGWTWLAGTSGGQLVTAPLAICGWASVAVALAWISQTVAGRAGLWLAAVAAVLLIAEPTLTRVRMADLGDGRSETEARMAYNFKVADLPSGAALIAESRRVDAAILLASQMSGQPAVIVPQTIEHAEAALASGQRLFALASGRSHLDDFGFLFERAWAGNIPVSELVGRTACAALKPGEWTDVSRLLANGSFILHGAGPSSAPGGALLRLADPEEIRFARIEPRSIPFTLDPVPHEGPGMRELDRAVQRIDVGPVMALRIADTGRRDPVTFTLVAPPQAAVATAEGTNPVTLCPGVSRTDLTLGRSTGVVTLPMASSSVFGPGWHSVEADPDLFRWSSGPNASIRLSMAPPGPVHLTITGWPAARPAQKPTIELAVNECAFPARPMPPGQADHEWDVPATCWRAGVNQLWMGVTPLVSPASLGSGPDTRPLGARVGAVRLRRMAVQNAK